MSTATKLRGFSDYESSFPISGRGMCITVYVDMQDPVNYAFSILKYTNLKWLLGGGTKTLP